ncbi:MAG: ankyrin repeat domain-containing protein, partial [Methylobacter sp.]|nr:ankyrin repeat domain-containing protein [Methylobacter sp.]
FSWSKVKSLFYRQEDIQTSDELIRILNTNYRNSPQVTEIANKILKIKNQRFGSIDKESHYLVESNGHTQGEVLFLQDTAAIRQELDSKTKASTLFAVIVMTVDQKPAAQQYFNTPLVFTIQEAKGLEYENIILYNFLSQEEARYREISKGVMAADLELDIKYARAKDKTDKSLEVYKFYINALYVAITRAVKILYWIESSPKQSLLDLLGLRDAQDSLQLANQNSSLDAWRQEAHKLELQGKQEQAERIRSEILKQKTPPWQVINAETLLELKHNALEGNDKAAKMTLFEYALVYEDRDIINSLLKIEFKAAKHPDKGLQLLQQKHYSIYSFKKPDAVLKQVDQSGPDFRNIFNQTPLMVAAWVGNIDVIKALFELGADTEKADGNGLTAFQIALAQTERSESYAKKKLADIYELLEPTSMSIQVDGRLVKLDKNSMEFFLLNVMIALFYRVMPKKMTYRVEGFSTQDFLEAVQHIPNSVLPERRKQRAYLSSILAKNEVSKEDKYNRKLFYRVIRGAYILNPNLAIKVEDEWVNIYDLLVIDRLTPQEEAFSSEFLANYNELARALATPSKDVLKKLIAEKRTDLENTHE